MLSVLIESISSSGLRNSSESWTIARNIEVLYVTSVNQNVLLLVS
jgi:hypothetical protein